MIDSLRYFSLLGISISNTIPLSINILESGIVNINKINHIMPFLLRLLRKIESFHR
jgi:hypothetical protein